MLYSSTAKSTGCSRQVSEFIAFLRTLQSQDGYVSVVTGLQAGWPKNRGSIPDRKNRFFWSPEYPD
jgi:hypothetical protein